MRSTINFMGQQIEGLMSQLTSQRLSQSLSSSQLAIWVDVFDELLICHRTLREIELGHQPCRDDVLHTLEAGLARVQADLETFFPAQGPWS